MSIQRKLNLVTERSESQDWRDLTERINVAVAIWDARRHGRSRERGDVKKKGNKVKDPE